MAGAEWLLRVIYWVTLILTVQGATELNATRAHQYFTSPNYPADYPHNTIEYWHIQTDIEGTVIELDVVDSYLEYSYSCSYDYIQVYDGENSDARLLKDFCGSSEPKLKSSGRHMYIKFRSDGTVNYRGFKMRYSAEDPDVNVGLIVGCVFAAIAGVAIIGCIVFFVCQAKSSAKQRVRPNNNNTIAMTTVSGYPSNHAVVYTGQGYGWVQPQPMMGANPPPYAAQPPAYATLGFGQNPQGVNNAAGSNASAPPPNSARGQQPPPYPGVHNPTPSRNAPPPPSTAPPTGSAPRPITAGFGMMPPSSTAFQDPAYPPPPASYQEP